MKIALILNRDAGTLRGLDADAAGDEIAEIFRAAGHSVAIEIAAGEAAVAAIKRTAKEKNNDAIVVGGGDGTISAAAAAAAESGIALGVLPLGTMNFFARSLAIPADVKDAAKALAEGEIRAVDIGTVNGRTFVHTVALGLHPALVEEREKLNYSSRYGKVLGSARAWLRVIRQPQRFSVSIVTDDARLEMRTAGLVVSNNPLGVGHMPYADRLDAGVLGLYVTVAKTWPELVRLTASVAAGSVADSPLVEHHKSAAVDIRTRHRAVPTTIDGELVKLPGPLKVEVMPGGLRVLAPVAKREDA